MPDGRSPAPALHSLILCPAPPGRPPSVEQWHDNVSRGRAVGWVRLRGPTESALAALSNLAVPQLRMDDVRHALEGPTENTPTARWIGELRVVTATVPTLLRQQSDGLEMAFSTLQVVATDRWVITFSVSALAGEDAMDRLGQRRPGNGNRVTDHRP